MRYRLSALTPVALMLFAATGSVHATSNAQMVITGNVVAATCDVSLSTSNLDLGNHTPAAFTQVAKPVPGSIKTFTLGLSNCQAPLAAGDTANVTISGQTVGGNPYIFNSSGTDIGVMLSLVSKQDDYISAGTKLEIAKAQGTPAPSDFNAKTITLQAGLASTSAAPQIGTVNAPVLFSFTYN